MLLHLHVSRTDDQLNFNLSTILKDPRRNSSFYDFIVIQSSVNNTGNIFVGNVADVIRQKGIQIALFYLVDFDFIILLT